MTEYTHLEREYAYRPHSAGLTPVELTVGTELPPSVNVDRFDALERRKCPECKTIERHPNWIDRDVFCVTCERITERQTP